MGLEVRTCRRPDGARLAYTVLGTGPPLVWIPGWINHLELMWERPAYRRFFQRLARHRTVILYDKHGVGLADRDRTDFTLAADVADLRTVLDAASVPCATLFGHSQAGAVAASFAVEQPDRVDRLLLHGAWAHMGETYPEEAHEAVRGLIQGHWGLAAQLFADIFFPDSDARDRAWFARFQRRCADAETALGLLQLCYELDVRSILGQIRAPTLVLHREGDRIAHLSLGREIASLIPAARFVKLPGRAHFPWEEDAGSVLEAIEGFLGVSGPGPGAERPVEFADGPSEGRAVLRQEGEVWVVGSAGGGSLVKDVKGMRYLTELLRRPGIEAHVVELVAAVEGVAAAPGSVDPDLVTTRGPDGDLGPALDGVARARYRDRLRELQGDLSEARAACDLDRAMLAEAEVAAIEEQLAQAVGLGGRDRAAGTTTERARVKVTRLLRDAVRRIGEVDPQLGHLLDTSVRTGTYCVYAPPPDGGPRWDL